MLNVINYVKLRLVAKSQALTTNVAVNTIAVDMLNFKSLCVHASVNASVAGGSVAIKLQGSNDGATNWADIISVNPENQNNGQPLNPVLSKSYSLSSGDNDVFINIEDANLDNTNTKAPRPRYYRAVVTATFATGTATLNSAEAASGEARDYSPSQINGVVSTNY